MNKLVDVVNGLIANTKANKIVWEEAFDRNGIQCIVADEIIQLIRDFHNRILIRFYDSKGERYAQETSDTIEALRNLCELAVNQMQAEVGVDNKFDAILSELNGVNR